MTRQLANEHKISSTTDNSSGQVIIHRLRELIDTFNGIGAEIRALLLDLARWMDETRQCRRDEICRKIKAELKEKIDHGKISERWIEECLPDEYKRKYIKSELSSLSRNDLHISTKSAGEITHISHQEAPIIIENDAVFSDEISGELADELEKHLLQNEAIENSAEFLIPKERYQIIKVAMEKSDFIRLIFREGILENVMPA